MVTSRVLRQARRGLLVPVVAPITGRYYGPRASFPGTTTTLALVASTLYAVPFWVAAPLRADQVGANVTALAASSHLRIGIYASAAGLPGARLFGGAELDSGGTGAKTDAIGTPVALVPGRVYWLAVVSDGTPTLVATTANLALLGNSTPGETMRAGYSRSFTYAALPDPWGTPTAYDAVSPALYIRVVVP